MATSYQIRRLETKGSKIFADIVFFDDELGEFNYGRWLLPAEVAALNADPSAIDGIIAARTPSALIWRAQTKAAEEYAATHPEPDTDEVEG